MCLKRLIGHSIKRFSLLFPTEDVPAVAVGQKFARVSLFVIVLESRRFIPEAGKEPLNG